MNDDETGFNVIPERYKTESGREKIDLIRDSMAEREFGLYCRATALKYEDRNKSEHDPGKRRWYIEMSNHIFIKSPDPRHARPGFKPYKRASLPQQIPERRINVLDHGFVRWVETWGGGDTRLNEAGIIEAARQSTQGSFRGWRRERQLLRYLQTNKHNTPFEFAGMVLEIRAPIFVFREWQRHRTQSYNEMSARYAPLPDLNYMPTIERIVTGSQKTANKQAGSVKGAPVASESVADAFREVLAHDYMNFETNYQSALEAGIPKELARCGMPVGRYSQMRAHTCLRNWLGFMTLRLDPAAQWEIRQFAQATFSLIEQEFPETSALFLEGGA